MLMRIGVSDSGDLACLTSAADLETDRIGWLCGDSWSPG